MDESLFPDSPNHELLERLYSGERSSVYRARDTKTGELCVLKALSSALSSAETIALFKRELELTRRLGETVGGVVRARETIWVGDTCFLVLEDIGGESLQKLSHISRLDLISIIKLIAKVAEILDGIHAQNIVHKDINPANIVVNLHSGELRIIDFGSASELSHETPDFRLPDLVEGTIAYMSPEQTGRMNRSLDYRSDFYSLGVTFYELLTGRLPFSSTDPLELMHAHIARAPEPPQKLDPSIPAGVSKIVLKLLEKSADDRYQSAAGLVADLDECINRLERKIPLDNFVPGRHDFPRRFRIAQKLYGRRAEIDTLMEAFARASEGAAELVLIKGFSGIGKSSLVHEVHKPITQKRGAYIAGKFDQLQRNIPYSALVRALTELVEQQLTEPEEVLTRLRSEIDLAVEDLGQIILELVPMAALLMGERAPLPKLSPAEAERRQQKVFGRFLQVFCKPENPLVLFIDDLQWADSATLKLLESLLTSREHHHLLLIGAYRDNEVGSSHPLVGTVRAIEEGPLRVTTIALTNLKREDIIELIADTLRCDRERAAPLAELLIEKTQGNAFFLTQFLKSLYDDRLITYERRPLREGSKNGERPWQWVWDIDAIKKRDITENVIELMAQKISRLPEDEQQVLKIAACLGNRFDIERLKIACAIDERTLFERLKPILEEGLLLPLSEGYKLLAVTGDLSRSKVGALRFLHDRVQEASYSLVDARIRPELHLEIGRRLYQATPPEAVSERVFEIVSQLDEGTSLISDPEEAADLARLNLLAGKKAREAMAYETAIKVLNAGIEVLSPYRPWQEHFELHFELHNELAFSEYLTGRFTSSQAHYRLLCDKAKTPMQVGKVYGEAVYLHTTMNDYPLAIEIAREGLGRLGIDFPRDVGDDILACEFSRARETLGDRKIADLLDQDELTDPVLAAPLGILNMVIPPCWLAMPPGFAWSTLQMVSLSQTHGNTKVAAFAYAIYALLLCGAPRDYERGREYGELALMLNERYPDVFVKGTIHFFVGCFVQHWTRPKRHNLPFFEIAHHACVEGGANVYAVYNIIFFFFQSFDSNLPLSEVERRYEGFLPFVQKIGDDDVLGVLRFLSRLTRNLTKRTAEDDSLDGDGFSEQAYLAELQERKYGNGLCYYYFVKMLAYFYIERFDEVLAMAEQLEPYYVYLHGLYHQALFHIYRALSITATLPDVEGERARTLKALLAEDAQRIEEWADLCPDNWAHYRALIRAETARVEGKQMEALGLYQQAITLSSTNGSLAARALADELCAQYWLKGGHADYAGVHMARAMATYGSWEAARKLDIQKTRYPTPSLESPLVAAALKPPGAFTRKSTSTQHSDHKQRELNLASLLKASHALAQEVTLDKLMTEILRLTVENAGAKRGVLILDREGTLNVEAELVAFTSAEARLAPCRLEESELVPRSLAYFSYRTGEPVLIEDIQEASRFGDDPYFSARQVRSILCAPIELSKKRTGVVYLENDIAKGAFSKQSLEIVQILATQAAISLQNALHISRLEKAHTDLSQRNEELEQQRMAILALSAPIIEIGEGILTIPLIGVLTEERARFVQSSLLEKVHHLRTRVVLVDMTGLDAVDEATAQKLLQLAGMLKLLGSRMVLTGIKPAVAKSILLYGTELGGLLAFGSLQEALDRVR